LIGITSFSLVATPKVAAAADSSLKTAFKMPDAVCPFSSEEIRSLHPVYFKDINIHMLETSIGPIGFDGGTSALSLCRIDQ